MKNNIAFDLDGTLVNFLAVFEKVVFERYGSKILDNGKFHIETDNNLSDNKIGNVLDEVMLYISLIKPVDMAVSFVKKLHKLTGEPIKIITARKTHNALFTNLLIKRYFKVPYFLAMVDGYKKKLDYLAGIDYYVEDRRACALYLAENGKKVFMPRTAYNKIDNPVEGIEFFDSFNDLMPRIGEFINESNGGPCILTDCKFLNTEGCRVKNVTVFGITKCDKYERRT